MSIWESMNIQNILEGIILIAAIYVFFVVAMI